LQRLSTYLPLSFTIPALFSPNTTRPWHHQAPQSKTHAAKSSFHCSSYRSVAPFSCLGRQPPPAACCLVPALSAVRCRIALIRLP